MSSQWKCSPEQALAVLEERLTNVAYGSDDHRRIALQASILVAFTAGPVSDRLHDIFMCYAETPVNGVEL